MLNISTRKFAVCLVICFVGACIFTPTINAQSLLTDCQSINYPSYSHKLQGNFLWLDGNTLVFKLDISDGDFAKDPTKNTTLLYQYDVLKKQWSIPEALPLIRIPQQTFQSLDKTDWALTPTTLIKGSPDGSKVIFPRSSAELPKNVAYLWVRDITTGIEYNLGEMISTNLVKDIPIFWFPDNSSFIVRSILARDRIIRFDGTKFTEEKVVDWLGSPFINPDMLQPDLVGISPSGRFFLWALLAVPDSVYAYDTQRQVWSFHEIGLGPITLWLTDEKFIGRQNFALSGSKFFEYDILNFSKHDLHQFDERVGSLSPDGRHTVFTAGLEIFVCAMPEGFPPSPVVGN